MTPYEAERHRKKLKKIIMDKGYDEQFAEDWVDKHWGSGEFVGNLMSGAFKMWAYPFLFILIILLLAGGCSLFA